MISTGNQDCVCVRLRAQECGVQDHGFPHSNILLYDTYGNQLEMVRKLYKERFLWCTSSILVKAVLLDGCGYRLSPYLQK